jgi:hypothetical protein
MKMKFTINKYIQIVCILRKLSDLSSWFRAFAYMVKKCRIKYNNNSNNNINNNNNNNNIIIVIVSKTKMTKQNYSLRITVFLDFVYRTEF